MLAFNYLKKLFGLLFQNPMRRIRSRRFSDSIFVVSISLFIFSFFRGLKLPGAYPLSHWLLNWNHGFIKRGLIGTLLFPFFKFKQPSEVLSVIFTISLMVIFAVTLTLFLIYRQKVRTLAENGDDKRLLMVHLAMLAYASSASVVIGAFNAGFFDHFLELICLASLFAVVRKKYAALLMLCVLGVLIHEMYVVYGFPVVFLAILKNAFDQHQKGISVWRVSTMPLLSAAIIVFTLVGVWAFSSGLRQDHLEKLKAAVMENSNLDEARADEAVFHLRHNIVDNYNMQDGLWSRFTDENIARTSYVVTGFILLLLSLHLYSVRRLRFLAVIIPVVLTPMVLHFFAWDTPRFSAFTTFHVLTILLLFMGGQVAERRRAAKPVFPVIFVLGLSVCINNLGTDIFWGRFPITEGADGNIRTEPPIQWFENCRPLFDNSKFESGNWQNWNGAATYFRLARSPQPPIHYSGEPIGTWFVRSAPMVQRREMRGAQSLVSNEFDITGGEIIFMMKGNGEALPSRNVSLLIDGREVYRRQFPHSEKKFQRYAWNVKSFENKKAVIRIVDAHPAEPGGIALSGFCYSGR